MRETASHHGARLAVFVTTLVVILVIATVASIIPAMSAARMRIASTLRYE